VWGWGIVVVVWCWGLFRGGMYCEKWIEEGGGGRSAGGRGSGEGDGGRGAARGSARHGEECVRMKIKTNLAEG